MLLASRQAGRKAAMRPPGPPGGRLGRGIAALARPRSAGVGGRPAAAAAARLAGARCTVAAAALSGTPRSRAAAAAPLHSTPRSRRTTAPLASARFSGGGSGGGGDPAEYLAAARRDTLTRSVAGARDWRSIYSVVQRHGEVRSAHSKPGRLQQQQRLLPLPNPPAAVIQHLLTSYLHGVVKSDAPCATPAPPLTNHAPHNTPRFQELEDAQAVAALQRLAQLLEVQRLAPHEVSTPGAGCRG